MSRNIAIMGTNVEEVGEIVETIDLGKSIDEVFPELEEDQEVLVEGSFTWRIDKLSLIHI